MTQRVHLMVVAYRRAVDEKEEEEEEEEEGGGSTCEAIPANTGDGFISRHYNRHWSRGYSPIARNLTHMARPSLPPPPLLSPSTLTGRRLQQSAIFKKAFFAYEIYSRCSRLMLHMHLRNENMD
ncbi:hypothetical protein OYC64_001491 [Pagothenia borchgrevinki]|uniref:Uncharacterized protein n=1 Tax=Pagothenia borchgrevinki TaxID=8213 RepID=A0ABD2GAX6_PAGBO